jgi:hypothetical protein
MSPEAETYARVIKLEKLVTEVLLPRLAHYDDKERLASIMHKKGFSELYDKYNMQEAHKAALFRPPVTRVG